MNSHPLALFRITTQEYELRDCRRKKKPLCAHLDLRNISRISTAMHFVTCNKTPGNSHGARASAESALKFRSVSPARGSCTRVTAVIFSREIRLIINQLIHKSSNTDLWSLAAFLGSSPGSFPGSLCRRTFWIPAFNFAPDLLCVHALSDRVRALARFKLSQWCTTKAFSQSQEMTTHSSILSLKMDFDYQKIKDEEFRKREERIGSLPFPQPRPQALTVTETPSNIQKPPIKPRRSIKNRPIAQPGSEASHSQTNQMENEERKRIAPSQVLNPAGPLDAQTPSLQAHNLLWFQRTQLPRLQKPVPSWLHGFATRREAEQLLQEKQQGCFLLRLSESKVGFVLSYRGVDKCRHFIIEEEFDASGTKGQYVIAGETSKHSSLEELINYYTHNPVGPFNETLTVPCVQSSHSTMQWRKPFQSLHRTRSSHRPETVQYAVVRKTLRKANSISESVSEALASIQEHTDTPMMTENETPDPVFSSKDTCAEGDVTHPGDAPYARVNKPQRPAQTFSSHDSAVCGAAAEAEMLLNDAAVAEQKYWELEPVHTYEEALHTPSRDDQIEFYAVGRQRGNTRSSGVAVNHVYSEVNIKGNRDDPMSASPPLHTGTTFISTPSSTRPRLPLRSAPRAAQPEATAQNSAVRNPFTFPSEQAMAGSSEFSIYEQIPERPNKSRPPLPPLPGPKR
ncbi:hypothetical protein HF521_015469 [Silurus meridionalis]|uniref:SH2 domain-containing protein n=1 Tax=Silurus meridionalis TaxID=175797 RepID=A0A8T0A5C9_SILME|nr:hypothetical protein HF521_015469 [Silurus meridionalis]